MATRKEGVSLVTSQLHNVIQKFIGTKILEQGVPITFEFKEPTVRVSDIAFDVEDYGIKIEIYVENKGNNKDLTVKEFVTKLKKTLNIRGEIHNLAKENVKVFPTGVSL